MKVSETVVPDYLVEGKPYDSLDSIALAYGITRDAVKGRLSSKVPRWNRWMRIPGKPRVTNARRVRYHGVIYGSISEMADALGIEKKTVYRLSGVTYLEHDTDSNLVRVFNPKTMAIEYDGKRFDSIHSFATAYGCRLPEAARLLKDLDDSFRVVSKATGEEVFMSVKRRHHFLRKRKT